MMDNCYTGTGGARTSERLLPDTIKKLSLDGIVNTFGYDRNPATARYL